LGDIDPADALNSAVMITMDEAKIVTARFVKAGDGKGTEVASGDRVVPVIPEPEAVVIAPYAQLAAEFTAGPNPVSKSIGKVGFFRQGRSVSGNLTVYDVSGNVIRKIVISDKSIGNQNRRLVGEWDLWDSKGRQVAEGAYLVRGVVKTSDGKSEKVSLVVGVR
jgi:hypothetical protein